MSLFLTKSDDLVQPKPSLNRNQVTFGAQMRVASGASAQEGVHHHTQRLDNPDPPLDWSSRAHVYPDEDGKPLIRISLEYSHELFPSIKTNGPRKHLLCIHHHPQYSGIWRIKKIHPGGKIITCYAHRDVTLPAWMLPGGGDGAAHHEARTPGKSPARLPPIAQESPVGTDATAGEGEDGAGEAQDGAGDADANGPPTSPMPMDGHPLDTPFWDVELHPDKSAGVPQNLSMTHRAPLADSGRYARRKKTTVCFAPPLLFHTRVDVHNVWKIDASQQVFAADVVIESRLRSIIVGEPDLAVAQQALDDLFTLYEVDHKALELRDADFTDYTYWHDLAVSSTQGRWDYVYRIRCKAYFNSKMDLGQFPWDKQDLALRLRLNMPQRFGVMVLDTDRPSHFFAKGFHLSSMWHVVHNRMLLADFEPPVTDEYLDKLDVTSQCTFRIVVARKAAYYVYNALVPMVGLTLAAGVSFCVGETASASYTGERTLIVLFMAGLVVFLKHATTWSLPHVAEITVLDQLVCMCLIQLALALFIHFIAARPSMQEALSDAAMGLTYLASCAVNLGVWTFMTYSSISERNKADNEECEKECDRRRYEEEKKDHVDKLRVNVRVKHTKYLAPIR